MLRSPGTCLLVLLAALSTVCSCRTTHTYEGEKLDREDIAVLKVPYYAKGPFVTIETIDGESVEGKAYAKLGVLPGHHALAGRARGFGQDKAGFPYTLDFIARPDATYSLELIQGRFSEKLTIAVIHVEKNKQIAQVEIWP